MERPIQEQVTTGWIAPGILLVMILMFGAAIAAHNRVMWLITGLLLVALPLCLRFLQRPSLKNTPAKTWVQTDDGLRCTYGQPPETETIRWDQIQRLRWVRPTGLILFWKESGPPKPQCREAFRESDLAGVYRSAIRVGLREADQIAEGWLKYRGVRPAEEPVYFRSRRPALGRLQRRAQGTVWLGSVLGAFFVAWAAWNIGQELVSASWPFTQGKIIAIAYDDIPWDGKHSKKGEVSVTYQYTVNGQDHLATQFDSIHHTYIDVRETAKAFASAHPKDSFISVYYDPQHPDQAVLRPGINWKDDGAALTVGLFFLGIAQFARFATLAQAKPARKTRSNWLMKDYGPV